MNEARAEGYAFIDRLVEDWEARRLRFDRPGETLLAVRVEGALAAIGGITHDPYVTDALRMRRFYVRPACRQLGLGRLLVDALLTAPRRLGRTVTVNAGRGSERFWQGCGFATDQRDGHTHILRFTG